MDWEDRVFYRLTKWSVLMVCVKVMWPWLEWWAEAIR